MIETKFRAWMDEAKYMTEPFTLNTKPNNVFDSDFIMQYTGLKDKNGKEIYDGDILTVSFGGDRSMSAYTVPDCVVFFCDKNLQWRVKFKKETNPLTGFYLPVYEITSNIYEPSDSLK